MTVRILQGDARAVLPTLPDGSVHCVVTSPPYFGLRDYGGEGQIGLEPTPAEFVEQLVGVMRECRRVLRDDGTLWLNLGDSYASGAAGGAHGYKDGRANRSERRRVCVPDDLKPKDLIGIPWRVAFALQADGWWLRQDIIWHKPNPMPESITDRCTKAHEYLFLLAKSERYYFDASVIAEVSIHAGKVVTLGEKSLSRGQATGANVAASGNGNADSVIVSETRNKRSVWTVPTQPYAEAHFATFPPALIEPCIKAGCPVGGTVLDPFGGAGTTGVVADRLGRDALLIELNADYAAMAQQRLELDKWNAVKRTPQLFDGVTHA